MNLSKQDSHRKKLFLPTIYAIKLARNGKELFSTSSFLTMEPAHFSSLKNHHGWYVYGLPSLGVNKMQDCGWKPIADPVSLLL